MSSQVTPFKNVVSSTTITVTHYDWGDWWYDEDEDEHRWVEGVAAEAIPDDGGDAQVYQLTAPTQVAHTYPELIARYRQIAERRVLEQLARHRDGSGR